MEPLWSPAVATGGNRWQVRTLPTRRNQAKTVAFGCHRLPAAFDRKEGFGLNDAFVAVENAPIRAAALPLSLEAGATN
jgi:hypothetical protein